MEKTMNYNVGNQALKNILANDSMDVGRVTVRHLPFSEALVRLGVYFKDGQWKCAQEFKNEDAKVEDKDIIAIFEIGFGNLSGEKDYVSPLSVDGSSWNNIPTQEIDIRKSDQIIAQCRTMKLTVGNCRAALIDLHANGRMGQEMSIDTVKTSDPVLCLDYANSMGNVKMMSRKRSDNDFNVEIDWSHVDDVDKKPIFLEPDTPERFGRKEHGWKRFCGIKYVCDERPSYTYRKINEDGTKQDVRLIHDFQQDLKIISLKAACAFVKEFAKTKQEFSPRTIAWLETRVIPSYPGQREVAEFLKQAYSTITNVQATRTREIREACGDDQYEAAMKIKALKQDMAKYYTALTKTLQFQMKGIPDAIKAAILISVIMTGNDKDSSQYSSYAHVVLDKEFLAFVLKVFKDEDKVAKYSEDKLISCTFKEGDVVEFTFGEAYGENGEFAKADDDGLDGEFVIRKNKNEHLVASKAIGEVLAPEESDGSVLCFITKGSDWMDQNLVNVMGEMVNKDVTLIPYRKQDGGKDLHDAIVVDGKMIGKFRTSLGAKNPESIQSMYRNKTGRVADMISCSLDMDVEGKHGVKIHKAHKVALVIMTDVKDSQNNDFVDPIEMNLTTANKPVFSAGRLSGRYCKPVSTVETKKIDDEVPQDGMAYFNSIC